MYKAWNCYDTLRYKRVIPCVLLKGGDIIQDKYTKHRRGRSRTATRKLHYLDDMQDVFKKCRDMYFDRYFGSKSPVDDLQESIQNSYDSEPITLLQRRREDKRRKHRLQRERKRAASFYGKSPAQVKSSDINALRKDNVL